MVPGHTEGVCAYLSDDNDGGRLFHGGKAVSRYFREGAGDPAGDLGHYPKE